MTNASNTPGAATKVSTRKFGAVNVSSYKEPKETTLYTLENSHGVKASITDFGATLVEFHCPDRAGLLADVVLGFDDARAYADHGSYLGATVGRFANRIANAQFTLNGTLYPLEANNGPNNLHGGPEGFDTRVWDCEIIDSEPASLRFSLFSPNGDQGFPGNVSIHVLYTLFEDNRLIIEVDATSDAPTPISITNHSYFNLAGGGSILDHHLRIGSQLFTPLNQDQIPTGLMSKVEGTPFDFRTFKTVGHSIGDKDEQLTIGGGYDHNFMTDATPGNVIEVAQLEDRRSGRGLSLSSDAPGLQLYTANFLDRRLGKGVTHHPRHALCLEPQAIPNAPNDHRFPSSILIPGEHYQHTMIFSPYITE